MTNIHLSNRSLPLAIQWVPSGHLFVSEIWSMDATPQTKKKRGGRGTTMSDEPEKSGCGRKLIQDAKES